MCWLGSSCFCLVLAVASGATLTNLPSDQSGLTFKLGGLTGTAANPELRVVAGVSYSGLSIDVSGSDFSSTLSGVAGLRLVTEGTRAELGGCGQATLYKPGALGFAGSTIGLVEDGAGDLRSKASNISFMLSGFYALCFSKDGLFGSSGSAQMMSVPRGLQVSGARLDCGSDNCFAEYKWRCFVYRDASSPPRSCIVRFDGIDYIQNTSAPRLVWGPTVVSALGGVTGWSCGASPSDKLLPGYVTQMPGSVGKEFSLRAKSSTTGFSVQACYCPAYDINGNGMSLCNSNVDFVQPVGRVIFFYTKFCDDTFCSNEYLTVFPGSSFVFRLDCGASEACKASAQNNLKVIEVDPFGFNDLTSWSPSSGCRIRSQTSMVWLPKTNASGGTSTVFKVWTNFVLGPYYVSGIPTSRTYDLCFCEGACALGDSQSQICKVGRVIISPIRLLMTRESAGATGLRKVGVKGDIMVNGRSNVPVVPLPAQMKLLWDNSRTKTSADCETLLDVVAFGPMEGPSCRSADDCSYKASRVESEPPNIASEGTGAVTHFNDGGTQNERIIFSRAGIIAVCYCGTLSTGGSQTAGQCRREGSTSYWMLLTRTMIRGPCLPDGFGAPCGEQTWEFFTGIDFRLQLRGLGLKSTDKIRIIPSSDKCLDNIDGGGEPTVLKNCPDSCNPLDLKDTYLHGGGPGKDDVDIQITTSEQLACSVQNQNCSSAHILEIFTFPDHTEWRFDVDPQFSNNDLVVLESVTGGTDEQNDMVAGHFGLEPLGWPVTRTHDPLRIRVSTTFDTPSPPNFFSSGGWYRTNFAQTREELKATAANSQLQVCWGSGPDAYHARAGRISFKDPFVMPSALISLSGWEGGRRSPAVIAFETSSGGNSAMKYKTATNSMQLRLSFDNVAKLEPLLADIDGQPLPAVAPADRNALTEAKQFVCGLLFLELWSSDKKGFPLPKGCYFKSFMDNRRELYMVFDPKNGLEAAATYQIVMNIVVVPEASTADRVLGVWSMDDTVQLPYGVVEFADARINRDPAAASGIGEPRFMSSAGFTLMDGTDELRDLIELDTDPLSLLFRLKGDGESRITAGCTLRIFLWPLTVWNIHTSCIAQCFPHSGHQCGLIQTCLGESVVVSGNRNVILIRLPKIMTEIYGSTVQHTVRISELSLPQLGFFGTRLAAQISIFDDSRVHYTESSGAHIWKPPHSTDPQMTIASIVTLEGDGDDKPFSGDVGNKLYLRLALGASLRAELTDGDASFQVVLPVGYTCQNVESVPSSLQVFESFVPQGRGSLHAGEAGGGLWSLDANTCEFRLAVGMLIPANTPIFLELAVDNPVTPLQKAFVLNYWTLTLSSRGWYRKSVQNTPAVRMVDDLALGVAEGWYSTNIPVRGRISLVSVQPSNFMAGATNNMLNIFFRPEQHSGYSGTVLVAAPLAFNFATLVPDKCQVFPLEGSYYRIAGGKQHTHFLPIVTSCISDCSFLSGCPDATFNRARLAIKNSLEPELLYGFSLKIINKADYSADDEISWSIHTIDSTSFALDASFAGVPFNPAIGASSRSWGLYQKHGNAQDIGLQFSSLRPTPSRQALAAITLFPVRLSASLSATCRLIAPEGFELSPVDFMYDYASIAGATASWPGREPWQSKQLRPGSDIPHGDQALNVLLWDEAMYLISEKYGFTSKLFIPALPTSSVTAAFFLEFGWDGSKLLDRPLAYALPLPHVRAIVNFTIGYQSNVVGLRHLLSVALETTTDVPIHGEVRVTAPVGFVFEESCSLFDVPGEPAAPTAVKCKALPTYAPDGTKDGTALSLLPSTEILKSGRWVFAIIVRNPSVPRANRGGQVTSCNYQECWFVLTKDDHGVELDAEGTTPGFPIQVPMPEAKLLDLNYYDRLATGRNDRPERLNNLIFSFTLAERPATAGELVLSGPAGFVLDEDCLPGLRTADNIYQPDQSVFGSLPWAPGYAHWEAAAQIRWCASDGPTARMYIELGLRASRAYVFRIHVVSNPRVMPQINQWTIEYVGESSRPFEGFTLWTFTDYTLIPKTTAQVNDGVMIPNAVTLSFRPNKEVRAGPVVGGLLRVTSPKGFEGVTQGSVGGSCAEFSLTSGQDKFVIGGDVLCLVDEARGNVVSFTFVGSKILEAGKMYVLVVQYYNPRSSASIGAPWVVATFSDASGALESALDSTEVTGFAINPRAQRWVVQAPSGEQHAGSLVTDVGIEISFAEKVGSNGGGEIHILAPAGFDLAAPMECAPGTGSVIGGNSKRLGMMDSLQDCAQKIWQVYPEANTASWNLETRICYAYIGANGLNVCKPASATVSKRLLQEASSGECAGVRTRVCTFSLTDRGCHAYAVRGSPPPPVSPTCEANRMVFRFSDGEILPALAIIQFVINTRNPPINPDLVDSFWTMEQYDYNMALKYSSAVKGWHVIPALTQVTVLLTGVLQSSGRRSQLTLNFVPVSDADELQVIALNPYGFNFSSTNVMQSGRAVTKRAEASASISMKIVGGVPLATPLVLENVVLPGAGHAEFQLRTFSSTFKADEVLRVAGDSTFVVPGRIGVVSQQLQTIYASQPLVYPNLAVFKPRINDVAVAVFLLRFGAEVLAEDIITVTALPFFFTADSELNMSALGQTGMPVTVPTTTTIIAGGEGIHATIKQTLDLALVHSLKMTVLTGPRVANQERWLFKTWRGSVQGLPLNTNDGDALSFDLVQGVALSIIVGRVAPRMLVSIDLIVDPGDARPTQLVLYAPTGYAFPLGSCIKDKILASSKVLSCSRLGVANVVELQLAGVGLQVAAQTKIVVQVPDLQEQAGLNTWLVEAIAGGKSVGWSEAAGFQITQMDQARVIFGGTPAMQAHVAVIFRTTQGLFGGGVLQLSSPEVFKFSCRETEGFSSLSLPTVQNCDDTDGILLVLNDTMAPGEYCFTAGVTNPGFTPADNRFSIILMDGNRKVVDAKMKFEGPRIVQGLYLRPLILAFSSTMPLDQAEIQVTLWVQANLDPLSALGPVRSLQIAIPERYTLITRLGVQNLDGLPTPESGWNQLYYAERLVRVSFVRSLSEVPRAIPAGKYRLSFQVRLPEFWMPNVNIWLLSLCGDLRCTNLISTLAVKGFYLNDPATLAKEGATGALKTQGVGGLAIRRGASSKAVLFACLVFAVTFVTLP